MIPYLHPEFIAVLLGKEPAAVTDSQTESNSNAETSLPVIRAKPAARTGGTRGPFRRKVPWSQFSRSFKFAAVLAVLWLL